MTLTSGANWRRPTDAVIRQPAAPSPGSRPTPLQGPAPTSLIGSVVPTGEWSTPAGGNKKRRFARRSGSTRGETYAGAEQLNGGEPTRKNTIDNIVT